MKSLLFGLIDQFSNIDLGVFISLQIFIKWVLFCICDDVQLDPG